MVCKSLAETFICIRMLEVGLLPTNWIGKFNLW